MGRLCAVRLATLGDVMLDVIVRLEQPLAPRRRRAGARRAPAPAARRRTSRPGRPRSAPTRAASRSAATTRRASSSRASSRRTASSSSARSPTARPASSSRSSAPTASARWRPTAASPRRSTPEELDPAWLALRRAAPLRLRAAARADRARGAPRRAPRARARRAHLRRRRGLDGDPRVRAGALPRAARHDRARRRSSRPRPNGRCSAARTSTAPTGVIKRGARGCTVVTEDARLDLAPVERRGRRHDRRGRRARRGLPARRLARGGGAARARGSGALRRARRLAAVRIEPLTERARRGDRRSGGTSFRTSGTTPRPTRGASSSSRTRRGATGLRAVVGDDGELIGFFNFVREGDEVRIGLGIRPDLTGPGARAAVHRRRARLRDEEWAPKRFRLWVAWWNERALRAYRRAGFREVAEHEGRRAVSSRWSAPRLIRHRRRGARGRSAVVALETTLVAHGFPPGEGVEVGLESERQVRAAGAVPATIGVLDGEIVVGLTRGRARALRRRRAQGRAARPRGRRRAGRGRRDDGRRHARRRARRGHPLDGDRRARRRAPRLPRSARRLRRPRAARAHAGARRLGRREVAARRAGDGRSCSSRSACRCSATASTRCRSSTRPPAARPSRRASSRAEEAARVARAHWELGGAGLLLGRPPDEPLDDVEPLIEEALRAARDEGVVGPGRDAVRPLVSPPRERRPHAAREPRPDRAERAARRRDRRRRDSRGSGARTPASASGEHRDEVADRPDADRPSRARTRRRTGRAAAGSR